MSLEVKHPSGEVIEVGEDFVVVLQSRHRKTITNGVVAFDVLCDKGAAGKRRAQILADHEALQKQFKQREEISSTPLRKTVESAVTQAVTLATHPVVTPVVTPTRDEEEEQEFLDATAEPAAVDPNDWYVCRLERRLPDIPVLIGISNGQTIWIHERDVTRCPGHTLCLAPGTEMYVRLEINGNHENFKYKALECQIDDSEPPPEMVAKGRVTHWKGSFGGARADCGCNFFIRTRGADEQLDLNPGDRVEFELMYSKQNQKWFGANISLVAEASASSTAVVGDAAERRARLKMQETLAISPILLDFWPGMW